MTQRDSVRGASIGGAAAEQDWALKQTRRIGGSVQQEGGAAMGCRCKLQSGFCWAGPEGWVLAGLAAVAAAVQGPTLVDKGQLVFGGRQPGGGTVGGMTV